ncbi:MAG: hypothetical protein KDK66_07465 [Deltaproteobacteria bacterium]|nr:hypothetical protein [Deltaproteobacteria bacterium]
MAFWDFLKTQELSQWSTWQKKPKQLKPWGFSPNDGLLYLEFCLPRLEDKDALQTAKAYVEKLSLDWVRAESVEDLEALSHWRVLVRSKKTLNVSSLLGSTPQTSPRQGPPLTVAALTLGSGDSLALERVWTRAGCWGEAGLEARHGIRPFVFRRIQSLEPIVGKLMRLRVKSLLMTASHPQEKDREKALKEALEELRKSSSSAKNLRAVAIAWDLKAEQAKKWGYVEGFDQRAKPSEVAKALIP